MKTILLLAAAGALCAAPPALQELSPRGAQRGKSFTLYLRGDALAPNARVETTLPAAFSRLTVSKDPAVDPARTMRPNAVLAFLVTLKPDAPVGFYPIRVATDSGISNVLLFSVSDLPEIEEAESADPRQSNDAAAQAQRVTPPVLINGRLASADIDNYSFHASAGEKLVFEVEARRAGSAIDPAIEIFDAAGREIARNDDAPALGVDARLEVAFPKAGEYRVAVHDSKYSDQVQNFYRLKIARFEYADCLFPLGGPKGTEVTLCGGNLARPVKVKAEGAEVRVPGSMALPLRFALSEKPERMAPLENDPLREGEIVNGRIARAGQVDRYRLRVEPGQKWMLEVAAAALGTSRLDALLTAYDAAGKKLAGADDGNGFDPLLPFTVPEGIHEITLTVEDLLGRGGDAFGYRLQANRRPADFVADLLTPFVNVPAGGTARVSVLIQRRGYAGEIRLRIPDLPAGFEVAGGHVPAEAAAQDFKNETPGRKSAVSVLSITAAAGSKPLRTELRVVAEARTDDGPIVRPARGPGMITAVRGDRQKPFTAPWLGMNLPVALTDPPPLVITPLTERARFAQGFEFDMQYQVKRTAAAKGAVKVNPQVLGAVGNLRILKGTPGKNPDKGSFLLDTNFATPFTTFDMAFDLQTEVDGRPVNVTSPVMEIEVVPGYAVSLASVSGLEIGGNVHREPTFEGGLIKLQVEDLPDGITCPAVEVAENEKNFKFTCTAGTGAKPGTFPVRISSLAPNTGKKAKADYKIPDLAATLQVKSVAGAVAGRRLP